MFCLKTAPKTYTYCKIAYRYTVKMQHSRKFSKAVDVTGMKELILLILKMNYKLYIR